MGFNATIPFEGSEAFVGGGCAYQVLNNEYQVMKQEGFNTTCEAAPAPAAGFGSGSGSGSGLTRFIFSLMYGTVNAAAGSEWQQVCACKR